MRRIPNIDSEKVTKFGPYFLEIIKQTKDHYNSILDQSKDRPHDPNRQTSYVHIISSDEERFGGGASCDDLSANEDEAEDAAYSSPSGEQSGYFASAASEDVRRFNAQLQGIQTMAPPRVYQRPQPRGGRQYNRNSRGSGYKGRSTKRAGSDAYRRRSSEQRESAAGASPSSVSSRGGRSGGRVKKAQALRGIFAARAAAAGPSGMGMMPT